MSKQVYRDNQKTLLVKKLAEKHGVTPAYVWMVLDGTRVNEAILSEYLELDEALELLFTNRLKPCIPQIISFKNPKPQSLETYGN